MSNNVKHPPMVVNGGDEFYRHFELEQVGWGVVAKVESFSDFPNFPFMLAAAPEMFDALEALLEGAWDRGETEDEDGNEFDDWKAARLAYEKAKNGGAQ